jgi:hypothetical protein
MHFCSHCLIRLGDWADALYFMLNPQARERRQAHCLGNGERHMPRDSECMGLGEEQDDEDEVDMLHRSGEERGMCRA